MIKCTSTRGVLLLPHSVLGFLYLGPWSSLSLAWSSASFPEEWKFCFWTWAHISSTCLPSLLTTYVKTPSHRPSPPVCTHVSVWLPLMPFAWTTSQPLTLSSSCWYLIKPTKGSSSHSPPSSAWTHRCPGTDPLQQIYLRPSFGQPSDEARIYLVHHLFGIGIKGTDSGVNSPWGWTLAYNQP